MDIERRQEDWPEDRVDQVLRDVAWLRDNHSLRNAIVRDGRFCRFRAGAVLIEQGTEDQDVFFLLRGEVNILVHGFLVAVRSAGQHVGEMAAINPSVPRSATVIARDEVVAIRLLSSQVWAIANDHPDLWRGFAAELARRLEQRGKMVERLLEMQASPESAHPRPGHEIVVRIPGQEGYLSVPMLVEIHAAAVGCGLATDALRELLLGVLPRARSARFPTLASPLEQILSDLNELNRREDTEAGALYLRDWLHMAFALRETHPGASLFKKVIEMLDSVHLRREPSSNSPE